MNIIKWGATLALLCSGAAQAAAPLMAVPPVTPMEDTPDVRDALNALTLEDLAGPSPRVIVMLERWFPRTAVKPPCASAEGWLSVDAVCEWYAPGANTINAVFPDMFLSISQRKIDSVVFWGTTALREATWECATTISKPVATACVPKSVDADRRTKLLAEWQATMGLITPAGN